MCSSGEGRKNLQIVFQVHNIVLATQLPHLLLVETPTPNRPVCQHCLPVQVEPKTVSVGSHGRVLPFQFNAHRATRHHYDDLQKTRKQNNIWTQKQEQPKFNSQILRLKPQTEHWLWRTILELVI